MLANGLFRPVKARNKIRTITPEPKYLTKSKAGVGICQDRLARMGARVPHNEVTRITKMAPMRRPFQGSSPR